MLKYLNTDIVFQEVPDETSLAINITGCPCRCPGCHSPYLWADTGIVLNAEAIDCLMAEHGAGITCVCFMGGDAAPHEVEGLAAYVHQRYPQHKVAWYSGRQYIPHNIDKRYLKECPVCHSKNVDYMTRIIGYLKRISNFSQGRQEEAHRRYYHEKN